VSYYYIWKRLNTLPPHYLNANRFIGLNTLIPFLYYTKYAQVDEEDFGRMDLLKEGFQPSLGLFLVSGWRLG